MKLWPRKEQWSRWSLPSKVGFIGSIASVLGLAIAAVALLPRDSTPPKFARVLFVDNRLVLPASGRGPVVISFGLVNTGTEDAVVTIWDRTYFFSTKPDQVEFPFKPSPPQKVTVPAIANAVVRGEMRYEFEMTSEKLNALNVGRARLLFYARGQYVDERNTAHDLGFSGMYDPTFPGNLVAVPQGVIFK